MRHRNTQLHPTVTAFSITVSSPANPINSALLHIPCHSSRLTSDFRPDLRLCKITRSTPCNTFRIPLLRHKAHNQCSGKQVNESNRRNHAAVRSSQCELQVLPIRQCVFIHHCDLLSNSINHLHEDTLRCKSCTAMIISSRLPF